MRKFGLMILLVSLAPLALAQRTITINLVNGHPPVFLWVQQLQETFIPAVNEALEGTDYVIAWNEFYGGSSLRGQKLKAIA